MCGIAGFLTKNPNMVNYLELSAEALKHRGPDGQGLWYDIHDGIYLAHRRLAILDLSDAGHQPMVSHDGRYVLVLNGEIYNHLSLRKELNGSTVWKGHSDTETLLRCIEVWGLPDTLEKIRGMFAFALWDSKEKSLTLARDRMGEKPLYFGTRSGIFIFASELKAIKSNPLFSAEINRDALQLYMRFGYVPSPISIYQDIYKLLPGTYLTISMGSFQPWIQTYWSSPQVISTQRANPYKGTASQAIEDMDLLLTKVVEEQMLSDVPLGALLSGGLDSTTVVSLMQKISGTPVNTFTVGFEDKSYNEASYALKIAGFLKTNHTEVYLKEEDALAVIGEIPRIYDEPFADMSQIPTYLISKVARKHVTVALTGDGGDEMFGGYNRYLWAHRYWRTVSQVPGFMRIGISLFLRNMPFTSEKMEKVARILDSPSDGEMYDRLVTAGEYRQDLVMGASLSEGTRHKVLGDLDFVSQMMVWDLMTYLPDDILVKVDRASMAVSLETRIPFLDRRVMELAWSMPMNYKIRGGQTKWILRQVLKKYIPSRYMDRPKMGFGVPIHRWLRGELGGWAEELLKMGEGYFNPYLVQQLWQEHLKGRRNHGQVLWNILMFQQWLKNQ